MPDLQPHLGHVQPSLAARLSPSVQPLLLVRWTEEAFELALRFEGDVPSGDGVDRSVSAGCEPTVS